MSNKINNYFQKKGRGRQELTPFTSNCLLPPCLIYRETHVTASLLFFFFLLLLHFTKGVWSINVFKKRLYIYISIASSNLMKMNTYLVFLCRDGLLETYMKYMYVTLNKRGFANQLQWTMQLSIEFKWPEESLLVLKLHRLAEFTKSIIIGSDYFLEASQSPWEVPSINTSVAHSEVLFSSLLSLLSSGRGSLPKIKNMQLNKQLNKAIKDCNRETEVAFVENKGSPHPIFFQETKLCSS